MKRVMIFSLFFLLLSGALFSQTSASIVKWKYSAVVSGKFEDKPDIIFEAEIKEGWHMYSQFINGDGPVPTTFTFQESKAYTLNGKVQETGAKTSYDPNFDMEISYFEGKTEFVQPVKLNTKEKITISGTIEFMVCNDNMCYPPETIEFTIDTIQK